MPVYERGKTTWRNRHSHSQAHPWQTHTSFFLSCLFMKEARPMKKWTFSDTQHQLFFLFHLYLWKRQNARRNQHFFYSHPDTQHQLSYFLPVYERGKPHGAVTLKPTPVTHQHFFHARLWNQQNPRRNGPQRLSFSHPSQTYKTSLGNWKRQNPWRNWHQRLILTPIPDMQKPV